MRSLGDYYHDRFRHILVDEFQDTNGIQYDWLKQLVGKGGAPFVVGDDDQSIYRWRGARVENMQHFRREFGATVYRLQQNYRSTAVILAAANAVIARNTDRMGKELWTAVKGGDPIRVYAAFNERDEADFVIDRIREHERRGLPLAAAAVLYRSNAQSRAFEEALMAARIPYRVYGGLRFFERAEIKDALSYLRLTQSRDDDIAFERVVNLPTRGIGGATLDLLRNDARDHGRSLWQAGQHVAQNLPARAAGALRGFFALIDRLAAEIAELPLHEQVKHVIQHSGLRDHHAREKDNKGEARVENLDELVNAAEGFEPENDDGLSPLASFLAHATLESGETQAATGLDCVQLMTLHAAKGLEFPTVFVVGLEEGLFPSEHSAFDADRLPEERRLCYVGLTRAMQRLYLTHAESRRIFGRTSYRDPSRFLSELPPEAVEDVRPRISVSRPLYVSERIALAAPEPGSSSAAPLARDADRGRGRADAARHARAASEVRRGHGPPVRGQRREPAGPRQLRDTSARRYSCTSWRASSRSRDSGRERAGLRLARSAGTLVARSPGPAHPRRVSDQPRPLSSRVPSARLARRATAARDARGGGVSRANS